MSYKIEDLRNTLIDMIKTLNDKDAVVDLDRAKVAAELAQVVVNSAKAEVDFMRVTGGTGSGFIENTGRNPAALRAVKEDAA
jgi:glutamate synthase domain-containing protein 2